MKVVIQRVSEAQVIINAKVSGEINYGLLLYLGIGEADNEDDVTWLSNKICQLRIFNDNDGVPNLDIKEVEGQILLVSQFTLHAKTKKGNRPSYIKAARPEQAIPLYEKMKEYLAEKLDKPIQSGEFGADMKVHSINDGPLTILIDTKNKV